MIAIEIDKIQKKIFAWYKENGRHELPWRHTDDLYHITVSEIMLQQTNVPKVIEKYHAFLARFPSWAVLSRASKADVVAAWHGLGYNRRALYLHNMAKAVVEKHGGALPEDPEILQTLPGMGPYTRMAVLVFGRNRDLSARDVNIDRVVRRLLGLSQWSAKDALENVAAFVPRGKSRAWHSALMDFASLVCTKKKPQCASCPMAVLCRSYPAPQEAKVTKRAEPGRMENGRHIPRRIFRGRIVEVLRKGPSTPAAIGERIKKDWDAQKDRAWLLELLKLLSKDGLVERRGQRFRLCL